MRSGDNDFNYFKLTKLANFVQFKRMFMFILEDWGAPCPPPLATPLVHMQPVVYDLFYIIYDIFYCLQLLFLLRSVEANY